MPATAEAINDQATAWVARIDRAPLNTSEQQELEQWLNSDRRHQGAFLRAQAAWSHLDRAERLAASDTDTVRPEKPSKQRWIKPVLASLAATLVASAISLSLFHTLSAQHIQTQRGEIRRIPLEDGSLMAVNTDTSLRYTDNAERRQLKLEQGEAWVHVAKDTARPFIVSAGNVRVQAVGTAFSVRKTDTGAEVLVTEGIVETWNTNRPHARTRLKQGDRALIEGTEPQVEQYAQNIHRKLAWRDGDIVLDGETLKTAVDEFNRYNRQQIVIEDAALENKALVGRFRTNEPEAFARAVAMTVNARAVIGPETIRLSDN